MIGKRYLGDGVYAEWEPRGVIKLTAENGIAATDTIYLEPEVYEALEQFSADITLALRAKEEANAG